MRDPVVAVCKDIMRGVQPADARALPVGTRIADVVPETDLPVVCTISGGHDYLLRKDWDYRLQPGDVVIFVIDPPQDRSLVRSLLQIIVTVVATAIGGPWLAVAANLVLNALLPVNAPKQIEGKSASPTYSTSLSGNQARLDECIPKICGYHRVTPPFAAQPYYEFASNGDQFYYAVFAVGVGNHDIVRELIDDTDIRHFSDVLVHAYLAPGVHPSTALANVVTAPEVSNQELKSGQYVGGFSACGPKLKVSKIGIDVIANRGLGYGQDDGTLANLSVSWRVEIRAIDDFGASLTSWSVLATETKTAATNEVQRWSFKYTLATAIRPEIRIVRTDTRNDSIRALHDIQWAGLRSYLNVTAPLNAHTAHYEVVMRASDQLSQLSQRQIALMVKAKCRTWNPVTGWSAEVFTRNPAWWLADLWTSSVWGEALTDDRIDLHTLYELSLVWEARQDRFDYVFDTSVDSWEAAQTIARAGRARAFRRNGLNTIARDQAVDLPIHAFTPRNTKPGSMTMTAHLPTRESADGLVVQYFDNRIWDWTDIECPCPGYTVTDVSDPRYNAALPMMSRPIIRKLPGITGATHAQREGLYEAASMRYRNRIVQCDTELQGMLVTYMSPVRWQPEMVGYGQSGDVAFWDATSRVLGLSEPPVFGSDPCYLVLIRDDGSLTTPVIVTPGPTQWDVVLPAAPDFELVLDDGRRERPKWLFGTATADEMVKISSVSDGGDSGGVQIYKIEGLVDDDRVHTADAALLPAGGVIQDDIEGAADVSEGEGGGTLIIVSLSDHGIADLNTASGAADAQFTMHGDGRASGIGYYTNEWLQFAPLETSITSRYEYRATLLDGELHSGTTGVWLSGSSTNTWGVHVDTATREQLASLYIEIREVSTGIIQDAATIGLSAQSISIGD
jgi:hypothetical protein